MKKTKTSSLVKKHYEMNPEIEDLVLSSNLQNNMIVLIEDPDLRQDISEIRYESRPHVNGPQQNINPDVLVRARMMNRWSKVTELVVTDKYIVFIAIYEDDARRVRVNDLTTGWIVKKDATPPWE